MLWLLSAPLVAHVLGGAFAEANAVIAEAEQPDRSAPS